MQLQVFVDRIVRNATKLSWLFRVPFAQVDAFDWRYVREHSSLANCIESEQKVKGTKETNGLFWNVGTNIATGLGAIFASYLVQW